VHNTGAVLDAPYKDGTKVVERLQAMLASDQYAEAARRFAARYASFDPAGQNERMVDRMEQLISGLPAIAASPVATPAAGVAPEPTREPVFRG
jgi:hypothetical protein